MKSFIAGSRTSAAATRIRTAALLAFALAMSMHAIPAAQQSVHGGGALKPQPGPNVNAAGGIVDPKDPAAIVKADLLLQRQNETVVAPSALNPDAMLAAWNDYRFIDFTIGDDGHGGQPSPFITRLLAKLFVRPFARPAPKRAAMSVGAWTGVGRTCDRGNTWIGGVLPGSPLDNSPASLKSPLKALSNLAETQGGHAETTDPVLLAAPGGKMHLFVLGFIRFPNGFVGESRMYHALYTHRNNHEGGACFNYEWTVEVDRASNYGPTAFLDKGSGAVDKDGTLYFAYTAFTDAEKSKIVIARLPATPGASWLRTMPAYSAGFLRNHGTTVAVDSRGVVHVAWRLFYQKWPLMVISHSYDRGKSFWPATPISHWWPSKNLNEIIQMLQAAKLQPFDQFTSPPGAPETARALGLPHLVAGQVNGQPKLFAVWQERVDIDPNSPRFGYPSATGSPRAVLSMSTDGFRWTERRAVDVPSGPQLQPVLSISGLTNPQLLMAYYQARQELDWPFELNFISGIDRQMDLRVARINPVSGALLSPSVQVSQYALKANTDPAEILDTAAPGVPQANFQNLTIYEAGKSGFFGDYPSIVPSITFERNSAPTWAQEPSSSYVISTDNRDVRFPAGGINGDWTTYTPVKPGALPADCSTAGMRNANPYFAEIAGVVAGSLQNFKPLNIQRAFATYYENRTPQDRFFRLTVLDNEAAGIDGTFDQFDFAQDVVDVQILAYSSRAQTVWVQPNHANPTASVRIRMQEIDALGAPALKPNGYATSLRLNPDPTNPALENVPPTAPVPPGTPTGIDVSEIHTPQVAQPQVAQLRVSAPQVAQPQVAQPQVAQPQVAQPQVAQPQVAQQQMAAPQVAQPQLSDVNDNNATDVTVTVTNGGTTSTVYNAFVHVPNADALLANDNYNFLVLLTKTSLVPGFTQQGANCVPAAEMKVQVLANIQVHSEASADGTIKNPQVAQPQVAQAGIATFALAPEGGALGQNSHADPNNEDHHSTVLAPETKITVRAIRNKPIAQILASGGQLFDPNSVVFRVDSSSTDVINGVVGADGTQSSAIAQRPDLTIVNYTPASPALSAPPGGSVTLSSWRVQNNGGAPTPPSVVFSNGFYLSTDSIITAADTLLAVNSNTTLAPGAGFNWIATTHTIPSNTPPGNYFIGILADYASEVAESNEGNNYVSEPITVTAAVACIDPPQGLVAWWPGDGHFRDIQGGHDGSDGSEGGVTFSPGKVGDAFTLDGDEANVQIPDNSGALSPAQLTVDFWFKSDVPLNSNTLEEPLVVKLNWNDDALTSSKGYDFMYEGTAVRFGLPRSDGFRVIAQRSGAIPAGEWHHVVGTFDGRYQRLYFDGALADTVDWQLMGTPTYVANTNIQIGRVTNSAFTIGTPVDYYFDGQIDEVELFSRALSQSEIQSLYNSSGKCRPIVIASDQTLAVVGQPLTLTAFVVPAPSSGATVEFRDGATVLATRPVDAQGVATLTTSSLSFAVHSLTAHAAGTLVGPRPSTPLTQHMVKRLNTLADFNAEIAGMQTASQNFNSYAVGYSFKYPNTNLISGVLDISSAFSFSTGHHLEVYPSSGEKVLFGFVDAGAYNPRTDAFGGYAYYYAYFAYPSAYHAIAFDIVNQDPSSSPALVNVWAGSAGAVLPVSNTSGSELTNVFIGIVTTLPMDGVYIQEGCEAGFNPCINEEIALDNIVVARP